MTFHLTCVQNTFSSFWEIDAHSVEHMFSLYFDYLYFKLFPVLVLRAGFRFWLLQFLILAYFLLSLQSNCLNFVTMASISGKMERDFSIL